MAVIQYNSFDSIPVLIRFISLQIMLNEDGDPIEMVLGNEGPIQFVIHGAGNVINSTERSLEVVTST
jgi:hypothetical protein